MIMYSNGLKRLLASNHIFIYIYRISFASLELNFLKYKIVQNRSQD